MNTTRFGAGIAVLLQSSLVLFGVQVTLWGQSVSVLNPSFESGGDTPDSWTLFGDKGGWAEDAADGSRAVYVTGVAHSQASTYWHTGPLLFEPNSIYRLTFQAKREGGSGGSPITGPAFCNRDLHEVTSAWKRYHSYFAAPSCSMDSRLRLGQWEAEGIVAFDDVSLAPVEPVYRRYGEITLGAGEHIAGNTYSFTAPLDETSANHARPLTEHCCAFNQPRWVFSRNSTVIYTHQIGEETQNAGEIEINIGYYRAGSVVVEARRDGTGDWVVVGRAQKEGLMQARLPEALFPSEALSVRLTGTPVTDTGDGAVNLQVYGYTYRATLDRFPGDFRGETRFLAVTESDDKVDVVFEDMHGKDLGSPGPLFFSVANLTDKPLTIEPRITFSSGSGETETMQLSSVALPALLNKEQKPIPVPVSMPTVPLLSAGECKMTLQLGPPVSYQAETVFQIPVLHEANYGWTLPDSSDEVALWWASSGWKVSRTRPLPGAHSSAMHIQLARNEREAAQFVLCPSRPLYNLRITATSLQHENGTTLPAEAIELLQVGYVPVTQPTDNLGVIAPWPDPLPPLEGAVDLAVHQNQPFWVRIHTTADTPAGVYHGTLQLTSQGWQGQVPLTVEVFDFTLPDRSTCVSAFGFDAPLAFQYHNVQRDEDKRLVYDNYLSLLSDHHISIYDPAFLDPIQYTWPNLPKWEGGAVVPDPSNNEESVLLLQDDSDNDNVSGTYKSLLSIPEEGVRITFRYKTGLPEGRFLATLLHHDASGAWMSGQNNDISVEGDGTWQSFDTTVDTFPAGAQGFKLRFLATPYTETGVDVGSIWLDDVTITNPTSGEMLLQETFDSPNETELQHLYTPEFDWSNWDAAMARAFDQYHFNSFNMPAPGLGGGTFHARYEPELLGYAEDAPQYKAAFTAWYQHAEAHLREKGWLDDAFIYWFDEPEPDDYEFVMNGFHKLKAAAPGLNRMLTEEVTPELVGGPNIWCPVSFNYNHEQAEQRRAAGDTFWWYICTGPKAPYATLFIDHPGTELRVWLWQTWERGIEGILIWQTNYWTSSAAYPDIPQNPYEDPMGWTSGYSTPAGVKRPWGNGDGRFMYPPLAAANGRPSGPVLDKPVGSIRLEMLRDGIEDYEYLSRLHVLMHEYSKAHPDADLSAYKRLCEVPDTISESLTQFTWDPAPIEAHRASVARAIVDLQARQ